MMYIVEKENAQSSLLWWQDFQELFQSDLSVLVHTNLLQHFVNFSVSHLLAFIGPKYQGE